MRQSLLAALLLSASALVALPAAAADLRIGLQEDPDVLDPDQSRTFVGRIVYASLCDKLVDITPDLEIVPMLATAWSWSEDGKVLTMDLREGVKFHDGTAFDAEAVKANIERSKGLPESRRKSEVQSIESVEVTGPLQVKITLAQPDATLLAQLSDRAGMMVSPTAASAAARTESAFTSSRTSRCTNGSCSGRDLSRASSSLTSRRRCTSRRTRTWTGRWGSCQTRTANACCRCSA